MREIEHGSFTPLVFTSVGGMAGEATVFYRRMASLLATKRDQPYAVVMGWLRCTFSFLLIRAAIMCVRGTRKRRREDNFSDTRRFSGMGGRIVQLRFNSPKRSKKNNAGAALYFLLHFFGTRKRLGVHIGS